MPDLLKPQQLHDYQRECVIHQLQHTNSMLWLQMGLGKEQPDSEPILTPKGWVKMGELSPGDYVIGSNGKPTKVLAIFPQGEKDVLRITFSDGSFTRCGWDHLWTVKTNHDVITNKPWRVLSTKELLNSGLKQGQNSKYIIPICCAVQYPEKALPIDPYVMGVILGDGTVSESVGVSICTDIETLEKCKATCIRPHETSNYTGYGYLPNLKQHLRNFELMGCRSWEKHVPEIYMRGSIDQRLQLLQGLLDTDGSPITCGGGVEFSSTSENLIDSVVELTQSLGGVARKKGPRITKHQGGFGRTSWRVNVKLPDGLKPFALSRKLNRWIAPTKYPVQRRIRNIEVIGKEHSTCISVEAGDNLYLTRNHIVTHNTVITLTSIVDRMRAGQIKRTLIWGPLRVIQSVWHVEARKWEHTKHLRCSIIHGPPQKRLRALFTDADIYLCNYENMNWLAGELNHYFLSQGKPLPFQQCVYDEVSKMKNSTAMRMAGGNRERKDAKGNVHKVKLIGWRKIAPHFDYRTGLTGTPASNGYLDLHGQYLSVDLGERLGEYITHYRSAYFASDYMGYTYTPTELGKKYIEQKISDITKKMDAADYLDLPAVKTTNIFVDLPPKVRKSYEQLERDMFAELESGTAIEVFSRASVSNKCLQFCNGSPYLSPDSPNYEAIHDAKLDALEDILEEAAGQPVLCSYTFKADAERIMKRFKKYRPVNMTDTKSGLTEDVIKRWNEGKIPLLIGHPASMGHGIDGLQESGSIVVWFGVNWSLELYDQMVGRIARQGQKRPVSVIRILCSDTVDLAVADAIQRKTSDQDGLKASLQRYRDGLIEPDLTPNFW